LHFISSFVYYLSSMAQKFGTERIPLKNTLSIPVSTAWILAGALLAIQADAQTNVAIYNPAPLSADGLQMSGSSQNGTFLLGLEFSVNTLPITITALGAFDSTIGGTGTGFLSPVQVGIYNLTTAAYVGPTATFSGNSGATAGVVDSYQFQSINALTLGVGNYVLVAAGYGISTAPDWNAFTTSSPGTKSPITLNNAGGAISGVENLYANGDGTLDAVPTADGDMGGSFNAYGITLGAPSMEYTVPEPSATELAFVGAALLGGIRFGRRFLGLR
jgi:hypothetical protein